MNRLGFRISNSGRGHQFARAICVAEHQPKREGCQRSSGIGVSNSARVGSSQAESHSGRCGASCLPYSIHFDGKAREANSFCVGLLVRALAFAVSVVGKSPNISLAASNAVVWGRGEAATAGRVFPIRSETASAGRAAVWLFLIACVVNSASGVSYHGVIGGCRRG